MKKLRIEFKIAFAVAVGLLSSAAHAASTLKQVQALEGGRVELVFDGKVKSNQIQTEFFGDTIQLTFKDAAVYPAKISNLNGHSVSKIFAYQYAPHIVRCRLTVKGKAEDFKSALQVQASGKSVAIVLGAQSASSQDSIQSSQAAQVSSEKAAKEASNSDDADRELQERVTASTQSTPSVTKKHTKDLGRSEKSEPLATGKPIGNPLAVMGKLVVVLAIFLIGAWIVRRTLQGKGGKGLQSLGKLGKLAGLKKNSPIEVVASHYLGPKKSIAVVKIAGRNLVLGVTEESINLITQLGGQSAEDAFDASADQDAEMILDQLAVKRPVAASTSRANAPAGASFDKTLGQAEAIPAATTVARPSVSSEKKSSVRSQIRSRLEGMKQL